MPTGRKPDIRPRRQSHIYLEEWLTHRKMTADELAGRLETSKSVISKLTNGKQRYNQDWLEEIAYHLNCEVYELYHPPLEPRAAELLSQLSPGRRKTAIGVLENLVNEERPTGTDG